MFHYCPASARNAAACRRNAAVAARINHAVCTDSAVRVGAAKRGAEALTGSGLGAGADQNGPTLASLARVLVVAVRAHTKLVAGVADGHAVRSAVTDRPRVGLRDVRRAVELPAANVWEVVHDARAHFPGKLQGRRRLVLPAAGLTKAGAFRDGERSRRIESLRRRMAHVIRNPVRVIHVLDDLIVLVDAVEAVVLSVLVHVPQHDEHREVAFGAARGRVVGSAVRGNRERAVVHRVNVRVRDDLRVRHEVELREIAHGARSAVAVDVVRLHHDLPALRDLRNVAIGQTNESFDARAVLAACSGHHVPREHLVVGARVMRRGLHLVGPVDGDVMSAEVLRCNRSRNVPVRVGDRARVKALEVIARLHVERARVDGDVALLVVAFRRTRDAADGRESSEKADGDVVAFHDDFEPLAAPLWSKRAPGARTKCDGSPIAISWKNPRPPRGAPDQSVSGEPVALEVEFAVQRLPVGAVRERCPQGFGRVRRNEGDELSCCAAWKESADRKRGGERGGCDIRRIDRV